MLTEQTIELGVEQDVTGTIFAISAIVVKRNNKEIARIKSRTAYAPGDDVSAASDAVKALAALWTPGVIAAYQALTD